MEISFKEAPDILEPTYQSIDLRAVLVSPGDKQGWRSLLTVIRFSDKSPGEISKEHATLMRLHSLTAEFLKRPLKRQSDIRTFRGMNVELSSYATNQRDYLLGRLAEGIINCKGHGRFCVWDEIHGFNLGNEQMSWRNDPYATDNRQWPVYYWGIGERTRDLVGTPDSQGNRPRVQTSELTTWARAAGFANFDQVCERLLGVPFSAPVYRANSLEIRAPVYAQIDDVITYDKGIRVQGSFNSSLGRLVLECSVSQYNSQWSYLVPAMPLERRDINPQGQGEKIQPFAEELAVNTPLEMGKATAVLFKLSPRRVHLIEHSSSLGSGIPFFKAFQSFVPEAHIEECLNRLNSGDSIIDCQLYKRYKPKDESKLLEFVTNDLLALCHLNPRLLAPYDALAAPSNPGSADILAASPDGLPLLVSCTMAMPDDRKANMLGAARTVICQRYKWPEENVKLLLVTGKPSVSDPYTSGIRTLAATDLDKMWELIKHGDVSGARGLIGIQVPSPFL
jgi:hypothetical protein